ncbi:MAG: pyridoxal phosphate-dependent decarboxylase family protein [Candidatus Heimdallarchaeota archaeon]
MRIEAFKRYAHELVDWMANYLDNIESYPVMSQVKPKEIINQLPSDPPQEPQEFEDIMADFRNLILPGITHWQHPSFFAYFPANNSPPSILAEMLIATIGAQCMIWQTSPAATELEELVMQWLGKLIGLPSTFTGVIQDSASTATLCSILTAREKASNYKINESGMNDKGIFTTYCSRETHSSIEKGVKIAGLGKDYLRKIPVDEKYALLPEELEAAIQRDLSSGYHPLCVIATLGTTGSTAIDPLREIGEICAKYNIWLHVDAALAGTALLLPEYRWMIDSIEYVDTFVFNPHKWMFTNFDCSAYFVKDPAALIQTFEILPEYLKTKEKDRVNNYRDWSIPLGRRFRALKLWFVIRHYGIKGLQRKIQYHIQLAQALAKKIEESENFKLLAPVPLNTVCFHYKPPNIKDLDQLNQINATLLERLNHTGKLYMTHTKLNGVYTLRLVIGQTNVNQNHVESAWKLITNIAASIT